MCECEHVYLNANEHKRAVIEVETGLSEGSAWVAVHDPGPGIPAEEQDRVVERFYRGRSSPPGGSGLGLAIARELTEKWGGSLEVTSPDGGGTRVLVRFRPVRDVPATDPEKERP